jgi:hypothetical protein
MQRQQPQQFRVCCDLVGFGLRFVLTQH